MGLKPGGDSKKNHPRAYTKAPFPVNSGVKIRQTLIYQSQSATALPY